MKRPDELEDPELVALAIRRKEAIDRGELGTTSLADMIAEFAFLEFMEAQMTARPDLIRGLSTEFLALANDLVGDMEVDPDEDLGDEALL